MNRSEALEFLHSKVKNQNLRRHCYAVEAVMRALARYFKENEDLWGLAGLLHDVDYELTKDNPGEHVKTVVAWLREKKIDERIIRAINAHGWRFIQGCPMPSNKMEWSLYCCDELTGLIVAVALVKGRKLVNVEVESVRKKFPEKAFATKVDREQIKLCEEKLGINLPDFIKIALLAMQEIRSSLAL